MPVPYTFQLSTSPIPLSELDANFTYFTTAITVSGTNIIVAGTTTSNTVVSTQVDITGQGDLRLQDTTGGQYVALQAPSTIATSYTLTFPVDDGTAGQALVTDGSGVLSWSSAASGDVYGPASATDNAVARFDSTTGKIIQNSAVTIADDGATVIDANSTSAGLRITQVGAGNALLVEDSANPDATPFVVSSVGQVFVGSTQAYATTVAGINYNPTMQMHAASANTPSIGYEVANWATTTGAGSFSFAKSRGGVIGTHTVVNSGDSVGETYYFGSDGTNFIEAARVGAAVDGTPGTNDMPGRLVFSTTADGASSPTERMRIDSAGRVGIGGTPYAGSNLVVTKNNTGSTQVYAVSSEGTIQSDVTGTARLFTTAAKTQATAFTLSALKHYSADQGTFGASSVVTNQYGYSAESTLTGATNNFGFHSNIASGTGRWNFYANGTADNYFAGNVGIGTTAPNAPLEVSGTSASMVVRATAAGQGSYVLAAASDYFSAPSYRSAQLIQYNASASGTSLGLSNNGLSVLSFQNSTGGAILTTGSNNLRLGTFGTTAISIANNQVISLGAAPGAESLRVTPVASAVNYVLALGATTGNSPNLSAEGSDTNINFIIKSKGTGVTGIYGNQVWLANLAGERQFVVTNTASAVNYLQATGGATGSSPALSAQGSDANVGLFYITRGTSPHSFLNASGATQFQVAVTASAVNYLQVTGAATGSAPYLSAQGSNANIGLLFATKGNASAIFYSNSNVPTFAIGGTAASNDYLGLQVSTGNIDLYSTGSSAAVNMRLFTKGTGSHQFITGTYGSGVAQFVVNHTASAVNFLSVTGGATGISPYIISTGSDANVGMGLTTKGAGGIGFSTNNFGSPAFAILHTASAVDYLSVTGSTAGYPAIIAAGASANVSPVITSKGTGAVILQTGGVTQVNIANTASAVNFVQLKGSATATSVNISAQGSDTNIDLSLSPKGTGVLVFGTYTAGILAQAGYITIKDAAGNTRNLLVG